MYASFVFIYHKALLVTLNRILCINIVKVNEIDYHMLRDWYRFYSRVIFENPSRLSHHQKSSEVFVSSSEALGTLRVIFDRLCLYLEDFESFSVTFAWFSVCVGRVRRSSNVFVWLGYCNQWSDMMSLHLPPLQTFLGDNERGRIAELVLIVNFPPL